MAKGWYINERKIAEYNAKNIKGENTDYSIGGRFTCDINTT